MSELAKTRTVSLDKLRTLKFNFRTIMLFEKETGKNFFKMNGEFSGTDTLTLLWACLKSAGEDITKEDTADIVDLANIGEISKAINELVSESLPEKKRVERSSEAKLQEQSSAEGCIPLEEKLQS
jgi:hypothetical protein